MWTFPIVFKLSQSAICAVGAFDLYWHKFEVTYSQHGLLIPTFHATQCDLHRLQPPGTKHVQQKGERTHSCCEAKQSKNRETGAKNKSSYSNQRLQYTTTEKAGTNPGR